jgi:hypothetical protein
MQPDPQRINTSRCPDQDSIAQISLNRLLLCIRLLSQSRNDCSTRKARRPLRHNCGLTLNTATAEPDHCPMRLLIHPTCLFTWDQWRFTDQIRVAPIYMLIPLQNTESIPRPLRHEMSRRPLRRQWRTPHMQADDCQTTGSQLSLSTIQIRVRISIPAALTWRISTRVGAQLYRRI